MHPDCCKDAKIELSLADIVSNYENRIKRDEKRRLKRDAKRRIRRSEICRVQMYEKFQEKMRRMELHGDINLTKEEVKRKYSSDLKAALEDINYVDPCDGYGSDTAESYDDLYNSDDFDDSDDE
jgi:hypothetical protein